MDWIANMPGPQFLGLYAAVIAAVLASAYYGIGSGPSDDRSEPIVPSVPEPYEMAYLRGGEDAVARLLLIELARGGFIQERMGSSLLANKVYLRQTDSPPDASRLPVPQRMVFDLIGKGDKPLRELFRTTQFRGAVSEITGHFRPTLEREGLLVGAARRVRIALGSTFLVVGLGGFKLFAALAKGKYNVGFLILLGIVAMFALAAILRARLTRRGAKHFRRAQQAHRPSIADATFDAASAQPSELLLHVGLFGPPILLGTSSAAYATMLGLRPNERYSASGCGSGCGGADSGGGGGDGGGCGGGCGGCGGD